MTLKHDKYGTLTFSRDLARDGLWHLQGQLPNKVVSAYSMETKADVEPAVKPPLPCKLDIMEAHQLLGHPGSEIRTREATSHLNWSLTGSWKPCLSCLEAKAKRNPVPKVSSTKAKRPGQRLLADLTG